MSFHFPQPQQRPLFLRQTPECVLHSRRGFYAVDDGFVARSRILWTLRSPPFRRPFPADAEEVGAQASTFGLKPVRPRPDLRKCLLHNVFCRLWVADNMSQEQLKPGRILPIEFVKGLRVSPVNPFPNLLVVRQSASSSSPSSYSGLATEKFMGKRKYTGALDKARLQEQNSQRRIKSEYASAAPVSNPAPAFPEIFPRNFMSSAVVSTPAAQGRPFVFDAGAEPEACTPSSVLGRELANVRPASPESPIARLQSAVNHKQSKIPPARITPASQLEIRPAPEMVSSGIPAIDALTGGLPRGCLTEVCGPASSGRTALLLAALAAATRRGEFCAVVDASDALDPQSVAAAGVDLERLLWVRCSESSPQRERSPRRHPSTSLRAGSDAEKSSQISQDSGDRVGRRVGRQFGQRNSKSPSENSLEQVLRATDLLLESGGFGLIALDLGDVPPQAARHIPLTTWFRFRRAIEYTSTILLVIEQRPIVGSCSSLLLELGRADGSAAERRKNAARPERSRTGTSRGLAAENKKAPEERKKDCIIEQSAADPQNTEPAHAQLLTGLNITVELIRSRLDRKPARSVAFETKAAWAG
jgi:hypothetical protein